MQTVQHSQCIAHSAVTLLARVATITGNIVQADVTSVVAKVYNSDTGTLTATITPGVSSVVFNSLQTNGWTTDSIGYNVAIGVPGNSFPAGDITYRVEVLITPVTGSPFYLLWDLQCTAIFSQ